MDIICFSDLNPIKEAGNLFLTPRLLDFVNDLAIFRACLLDYLEYPIRHLILLQHLQLKSSRLTIQSRDRQREGVYPECKPRLFTIENMIDQRQTGRLNLIRFVRERQAPEQAQILFKLV